MSNLPIATHFIKAYRFFNNGTDYMGMVAKVDTQNGVELTLLHPKMKGQKKSLTKNEWDALESMTLEDYMMAQMPPAYSGAPPTYSKAPPPGMTLEDYIRGKTPGGMRRTRKSKRQMRKAKRHAKRKSTHRRR